MNIKNFKEGDTIVRVLPSKIGDRSYIGKPMKFIGVANALIYFKHLNDFEIKMFGDKISDLQYEYFCDGWELWINPESLNGECVLSLSQLKKDLKDAINSENYERAEELKLKIKNFKTK
jgi:hypothetical protein